MEKIDVEKLNQELLQKPSVLELPRSERVLLIAAAVHEVQRAYCIAAGMQPKPEWRKGSEDMRGRVVRAVEMALLKWQVPSVVERAQKHDSWVQLMQSHGWTFDMVENQDEKKSPLIKQYAFLDEKTKTKEIVFYESIFSMARAFGWPLDTNDVILMFLPKHAGHKLQKAKPVVDPSFKFTCSCGEEVVVTMPQLWQSGVHEGAFQLAVSELPLPERSYLLRVMDAMYQYRVIGGTPDDPHRAPNEMWVNVNAALKEYVKRTAPAEVPWVDQERGSEMTMPVMEEVLRIAKELKDDQAPSDAQLKSMREVMKNFVAQLVLSQMPKDIPEEIIRQASER